jgi:acyl-CoA thioester hydrolase
MSHDNAIFRHSHPMRVRSYHVDRQNVVHNLWYFYFFEEARVEYVRAIGMVIDEGTFVTHDKFFVVRNTCDYAAPALYDEVLDIRTRVSAVGNSSITFDGSVAARGTHVLVHVDEQTNTPSPVPEHVRALIDSYEAQGRD